MLAYKPAPWIDYGSCIACWIHYGSIDLDWGLVAGQTCVVRYRLQGACSYYGPGHTVLKDEREPVPGTLGPWDLGKWKPDFPTNSQEEPRGTLW